MSLERAVAADVRNIEQVENAVNATVEKYGRIDYLINGAAGNFLSPFENLTYNAFRTVIEIDLIGKHHLCFGKKTTDISDRISIH
jgi:peroxisomal 2,4-dienoyl-CoA reductase